MPHPHPSLLVRADYDDTAVRRACARGDLVRLVAGRYLRREHWLLFDDRERHVMFCLAAVSRLSADVVVSHASAAAFWGLPRLGPWPARAHVTDPGLARGSANASSYAHAGRLGGDDVDSLLGVPVTSPARTAVDLAVSAPMRQSVVALDHCLRKKLVTASDLDAGLRTRTSRRGAVRARRAIEFADPRADRPGESLSRMVMFESGFLRPELQRRFPNAVGKDAVVDFFWSDAGVVGEFDGETKYRDSVRWSGLSPEQVVINEKDRENWLHRQRGVRTVARWTWTDALTPGRLAGILLEAGVPLGPWSQGSSPRFGASDAIRGEAAARDA